MGFEAMRFAKGSMLSNTGNLATRVRAPLISSQHVFFFLAQWQTKQKDFCLNERVSSEIDSVCL